MGTATGDPSFVADAMTFTPALAVQTMNTGVPGTRFVDGVSGSALGIPVARDSLGVAAEDILGRNMDDRMRGGEAIGSIGPVLRQGLALETFSGTWSPMNVYREGELACERKYHRLFKLNHWLQGIKVLSYLAGPLEFYAVLDRSNLYVLSDEVINEFYFTLSEVSVSFV